MPKDGTQPTGGPDGGATPDTTREEILASGKMALSGDFGDLSTMLSHVTEARINTPNFINIINKPLAQFSMYEAVSTVALLGLVAVMVWHGMGHEWTPHDAASAAGLVVVGMVMVLVDRLDEE